MFSLLTGDSAPISRDFATSEVLEIGTAPLLYMLRHARAGIPLEVMGLMMGYQVDKYLTRLTHVFAFPQTATGVNVEAIDAAYQSSMMEMLEKLDRTDRNIGWYHSHPGFGCWLSHVDLSTHSTFEAMDIRSIALVLDPIQSVKGKVVLDAFRSIPSGQLGLGRSNREVTSVAQYEDRPTITALLRGLDRQYYSLRVRYAPTPLEVSVFQRLEDRPLLEDAQPSAGEFEFEQLGEAKESAGFLGEKIRLWEQSFARETAALGKVVADRVEGDRLKEEFATMRSKNETFVVDSWAKCAETMWAQIVEEVVKKNRRKERDYLTEILRKLKRREEELRVALVPKAKIHAFFGNAKALGLLKA